MKKNIFRNELGMTNYRYKTEVGEISLIHPCYFTLDQYEIFSIDGNLFEDIERYSTLEEAEKRITELLKYKNNDK